MKRFISVLLIVLVLLVSILGIGVYYSMNSPMPTPTPIPFPTPTVTSTPTPTTTLTPIPPSLPFPILLNTMDKPEYWGIEVFATQLPEVSTVVANAPQYALPLPLNEVVNINDVVALLDGDEKAQQRLRENGFVVIPSQFDDFAEFYMYVEGRLHYPIFVSADSMLHIYHVFFDEILLDLEETYFSQDLTVVLRDLINASVNLYNSIPIENGVLRDAAKRNVAFFSVGLQLIDPSFEVPAFVETVVHNELKLIEAHQDFTISPLFEYEEDYSQYVPRGHYTRSEVLQRYFKCVMYLGRMRFMIHYRAPEIAHLQTIQAVLITDLFNQLPNTRALWERIYVVTSFFVGHSDDLTFNEYTSAIHDVYGMNFDITNLENFEQLTALQNTLMAMNHAKIVSSSIVPGQEPELVGLRVMGQRFIPDSYMFQELVYDKVDGRGFPKGLDVMAVLGSDRALEHLQDDVATYPGYKDQLDKLRSEFSDLSVANWTQNLYWSWLYTLESIQHEIPAGYPTFMTTPAWQDKQLTTALGSWTELRHDTILYAKQSYTLKGMSPEPPSGYVEPQPQLYSRLIGLCNMTMNGLNNLGLLDNSVKESLTMFRSILDTLTDISLQELKDEPLSPNQKSFIRSLGKQINSFFTPPTNYMNLTEPENLHKSYKRKTTLVADVHTDPNTMQVLEEAVGYLDVIIVVYQAPDGDLVATVGPVFSYYEFTQPISERLTDEAWIEMLDTGNAPSRPSWIPTSYFVVEE